MIKYGFLLGAGAELAYNLPSGGRFALDIFWQDPNSLKHRFREIREDLDLRTSYANTGKQWLDVQGESHG